MVEEFIPIVLFLVGGPVFSLFFHYRYRSRMEKEKTIRMAIEKGNEPSPEFMQSLAEPEPTGSRDLRRGVIWLSLAIGLVLCGLAIPDPTGEVLRGCLAGAAFPFTIGVAYLIMWRYGSQA